MSSHRSRRAYAVDPRAAGRRRIVGATTVTAVGGTALAVFFGSLFAQAFAAGVGRAEARARRARCRRALTVPDKTTSAKHTAAPQPPAAAPQTAHGAPAASSGGS